MIVRIVTHDGEIQIGVNLATEPIDDTSSHHQIMLETVAHEQTFEVSQDHIYFAHKCIISDIFCENIIYVTCKFFACFSFQSFVSTDFLIN